MQFTQPNKCTFHSFSETIHKLKPQNMNFANYSNQQHIYNDEPILLDHYRYVWSNIHLHDFKKASTNTNSLSVEA